MPIKLKVAVANGNWSNPATWSNGVKPQPGDVVALNGRIVTLNEDCNVDSITTRATFESQVDLIPFMQSNVDALGTTGRGEVISWDNNTNAYLVFRTTLATNYTSNTFPGAQTLGLFNGINNLWIGYKFNTATVVDGIFFRNTSASTNRNVRQFAFEASNDGISWTLLHTSTVLFGQNYIVNGIGNTNAYTYYRMRVISIQNTSNDTVNISALLMFPPNTDLTSIGYPLNSGGRLIISNTIPNINITCTGAGILGFGGGVSDNIITYTGTGTLNINSNVYHIGTELAIGSILATIRHTGTGTLNVTGNIPRFLLVANNQIKDYMMYHNGIERYGCAVYSSGAGITNITGDVSYDNAASGLTHGMIRVDTGHTLNITGDTYFLGTATITSGLLVYVFFDSSVNYTGDILMINANSDSPANFATISNCTFTHTGKIEKLINTFGAGNLTFTISQPSAVKKTNIIGPIINTNVSDALIMKTDEYDNFHITGPLIFSNSSYTPLHAICYRFIANTVNTFIRLRDTNNNAYTLVSPDTIVDSPAISDVRLGVIYANGNYTGTLAVPNANQVSVGIPIGNTVGTALLTPDAVWNHLTTNMTTPNSIGERLKNAATVDTTGSQIASFQ